MIKPVTFQGCFNFNANLYSLEVRSRFIDQSKANGYYAGYGSELAAQVVGQKIQIGTGAFLVQGRMCEITASEMVSPSIFDGFVGYVVARIETYHPSDDENCTLKAVVNKTYDAIALEQNDTYAVTADNVNTVYELPLYSFEISGTEIVNLKRLIEPIADYATIKKEIDATLEQVKTAITTSSAANTTANNAKTAADNAVTKANDAVSKATSAVATSNTANEKSDNAVSVANAAKTAASDATTVANNAKSQAQTAEQTANDAVSKATSAVATSNTANEKSDNAVSVANAAKTAASDATTVANNAKSQAQTAEQTANGADEKADNAINQASDAVSKAQSAVSTANGADEKADNAVSVAQDAETAASNALTKATDAKQAADDAATLASTTKTETDQKIKELENQIGEKQGTTVTVEGVAQSTFEGGGLIDESDTIIIGGGNA